MVGTAIVTRYGTSLAVLSMVLVASQHGGQGLGRQLVTQALAATPTRTAALFATEAGRPLYEKFGFTAVEELHTYVGSVPGHATARSRPATPEDVSAIAALDAAIVGAPRGELVQRLLSFATRLHVVELDDHIVGYGAAWWNLGQLMIGPVVAADRRAAKQHHADGLRIVSFSGRSRPMVQPSDAGARLSLLADLDGRGWSGIARRLAGRRRDLRYATLP